MARHASPARIAVEPKLLRWARERARLDREELARRFPNLAEWEAGTASPTLKQLEKFAQATHAPFGYFFLPEPPKEPIPIPDFRTAGNVEVRSASADLLDTIYVCQQRQEWYRNFVRLGGASPLSFVGSAQTSDDIEFVAHSIRTALNFNVEERRALPRWTDALRQLIEQADAIGVLVMVNGVVGNNNHRKLKPEEFRGFALADDLAPLIFINGSDSKAAQMFTLAHELAHIWLGQSSLDDVRFAAESNGAEQWCNAVAAEILAPIAMVKAEYRKGNELRTELDRLARYFKVSTLVVLQRIFDAGGLTGPALRKAYEAELHRLDTLAGASGGNFYLTQGSRVGKRFARALIISTLEGQTLYRDAFALLGFAKIATFHELGHALGVA